MLTPDRRGFAVLVAFAGGVFSAEALVRFAHAATGPDGQWFDWVGAVLFGILTAACMLFAVNGRWPQ